MKRCSKCQELKTFDEFYRQAQNKDGLFGHCKACHKINNEMYRKNNPGYDREWRKNNPDRKRELLREWQRNNRDRMHGYDHARRAKAANAFTDCQSFSQVLIRSIYKSCLRCGSPDELEIDHVVPLSKGGTSTLGNYQVLCRSCNASKNNRNSIDYRPSLLLGNNYHNIRSL